MTYNYEEFRFYVFEWALYLRFLQFTVVFLSKWMLVVQSQGLDDIEQL